MKLLKTIMPLKLLVFLSFPIFCQVTMNDKRINVAHNFINAYNQQNYSNMKKDFFMLAKVLPIKKSLKQEFLPRYNTLGVAFIGKIQPFEMNQLKVELKYKNKNSGTDELVFSFTKKNKINGLYFKQPDFNYLKNNDSNADNKEMLKSKIDSLVTYKFRSGFNGGVLVLNNEQEIYKKCFGYSNFQTHELINDSSLFELASCSKQFTAMAIMILVEQGKLNLNDTIQKIISDFPYKNITIENLLTHTSGLPDYMELIEQHWDKTKFATNDDILNLFKKYKPKTHFLPNQSFEYSNTGYALLSIVIEKISNVSYNDFLENTIFKKLGMKNSRVYNTRRCKIEKINNYAYGYVFSKKDNSFILPDSLMEYKFVKYMDAITGDGTVNTCLSDIAIWDKALRENILISKNNTDKLFSTHKLNKQKISNYGFGQFVNDNDTMQKVAYHGGSWPGYETFMLRFLDKKLTVVVLSNNNYDGVAKLANQIALIILDAN